MIPMYYGGIDRIYGDISTEGADKILDLVDEYTDLKESISVNLQVDKITNHKSFFDFDETYEEL